MWSATELQVVREPRLSISFEEARGSIRAFLHSPGSILVSVSFSTGSSKSLKKSDMASVLQLRTTSTTDVRSPSLRSRRTIDSEGLVSSTVPPQSESPLKTPTQKRKLKEVPPKGGSATQFSHQDCFPQHSSSSVAAEDNEKVITYHASTTSENKDLPSRP